MTQFNLPTHSHTLASQPQDTINARDLHQRLGVETRIDTWLLRRIENYGFIEGEDFCSTLSKTSNWLGGRPRTEYFLSINMAKELAMLENNPQGRAIRRALIEMERQLREDVPALIRKLKAELGHAQEELLIARPEWVKIEHYRSLGLSQAEVAKLVELNPSTLRRHLKRMASTGIGDYQPSRHYQKLGRLGHQAQQLNLLEGGAL